MATAPDHFARTGFGKPKDAQRGAGMRRLAGVLPLAAALAGCAAIAPGSRTVTIERTAYGIAHITAPNYEALGFGSAYAHARDKPVTTPSGLKLADAAVRTTHSASARRWC